MAKGLILLPNTLGPEGCFNAYLPPVLSEVLPKLTGLIAESEKRARAYLKHFLPETFRNIPIYLLNEHSTNEDISDLIALLRKRETWGLISDCGLPSIADPGAELVRRAHGCKIPIQAYPGPSSLSLALMLSGLSGQTFTFHGYLPRAPEKRKEKIAKLNLLKHTHLFIEAPYRNEHLLKSLLENLSENTHLCVAWNLTLPDQGVIAKKVKEWKASQLPDIRKKPAVFIIGKS